MAQARYKSTSSNVNCFVSAFQEIGFLRENKRVYPSAPLVSHVIGLVNIDNQGIAGIERWLDVNGLADLHMAGLAIDRQQEPVQLALDLRVQLRCVTSFWRPKSDSRQRLRAALSLTCAPARSSQWYPFRILTPITRVRR